MLLVEDVGSLYDAIKPFYDKARDIARAQKEKTVNDFLRSQKYGDLALIAKSTRHFELKFKMVNFTNNTVYAELVRTYFSFPECRFSAIVIDRKDPDFKPDEVFANPWSMYMSYAAMLLAGNINNLDQCRVCVLADDLSKPKRIKESFEEALKRKIHQRIKDDGIERRIFNVARLESHSSLMLQLVDILLGTVLYDFKKQKGVVGAKLAQRQEPVVSQLRQILDRESLASHFTSNKPSYFNIWKMKWRKD